jgi:hypothetical protein
MDRPRSELKFMDAKDLDDSGTPFAGIDVTDSSGETLGEVEGFIMDAVAGVPRHVVVSAGWFIHKHFLLPIGHAKLDADGRTLIADISKDRVKRFPGFSKAEFERLDSNALAELDTALANACVSELNNASTLDDHYRVPGWWKSPAIARRDA